MGLVPNSSMKKLKYHKKIRLDQRMYHVPGLPCSVTICIKGRKCIFEDKSLSSDFLDLLGNHAKRVDIPLYAYCIMPDHIHLLMSASPKKGIVEFVREVKSLSTRIFWKYGYTGKIWQASFYDHFLREDEDLQTVTGYILNNPVRRGIVKKWEDYGFCGSWVFDL